MKLSMPKSKRSHQRPILGCNQEGSNYLINCFVLCVHKSAVECYVKAESLSMDIFTSDTAWNSFVVMFVDALFLLLKSELNFKVGFKIARFLCPFQNGL